MTYKRGVTNHLLTGMILQVGNPKDSVWEDMGTPLGNLKGITTTLLMGDEMLGKMKCPFLKWFPFFGVV